MQHPLYYKAKDISDIIVDYRAGELDHVLDADHVIKWVDQFNAEAREVVLDETYRVLSNWYFGTDQINEFLSAIIAYLLKQGVCLDEVTFWNGQKDGNSQAFLLRDLKKLFPKYEINVDTIPRKRIIYIDDGLYTGSKLKKEIKNVVDSVSQEVETIDVFVLIAYSNGLSYLRRLLNEYGSKKEIQVRIDRYRELFNDKQTEYSNNEETYTSSLGVLWPSRALSSKPAVKEFDEYLSSKGAVHLKYKTHTDYSPQLFTTLRRQETVEKEFLLCGLNLLSKASIDKGIYPLGYDVNRSFGFGSFCATKYNISNTCPIVLWWNVDDSWYPLLPRRI